jgi:hypothetical protein
VCNAYFQCPVFFYVVITYVYVFGPKPDVQLDSFETRWYCNVYLEAGRHLIEFFPDDFGRRKLCFHYAGIHSGI